MTQRKLGDAARANVSLVIASVPGLVAFVPLSGGIARTGAGSSQLLITYYLVTWPIFVGVYLVWTHRIYARLGPSALEAEARREATLQRRWYSRVLGYSSATSWTLSAALLAVLVVIIVTQTPALSGSTFILLGLLTVASSWALMVYVFALAYVRLNAAHADDGTRHIDPHVDGAVEFSDYLTLALLLSTMAATISASIHTREAWRLVRTNVLLAFVFNSVILAMVVSLLFGGLVD